MAIMNEILVGRFNHALQRLTGIKGGPPTPQLAGEIMAVLSLGYGVDCRYLESWDRFHAQSGQAAVAAQNSRCRIRNPAGSNVIVVVEKVVLNVSVANNLVFLNQGITTDLGTTFGAITMDSRSKRASTAIISAAAAAVTPSPVGLNIQAQTTPYDIIADENQEITILPGDGLDVWVQTVNIGLNVGWMWRERYLEESERL